MGRSAASILNLFVFLVAALGGAVFPLLCNYARSNKDSVGEKVSWIYFANIIGSTLGPITTGFFFLDYWSTSSTSLILSISGVLIGVILASYSKVPQRTLGFAMILTLTIFSFHRTTHESLWEKFHYKNEYTQKYKYIHENRSGVISVDKEDNIYGGGAYDGAFSTDLTNSNNSISRTYFMSNLHPNPKKVLVIGLSSGSWVRILKKFSNIKTIDVVEINPGYRDVMENYPDNYKIYNDKNIKIHYEDGRRHLKKDNQKYDFILMNTTWHWRSNITNLLSLEFLNICKKHLNPGGVIYYNTTFSKDVSRTTAEAFKYVTFFGNFIAGSDYPFNMTREQRYRALQEFYNDDGSRYFESSEALKKWRAKLLAHEIIDIRKELIADQTLNVITDNNMFSEYKNMRSYFDPKKSWEIVINNLQ